MDLFSKLPTDNLYKFMAIAGLFSAAFLFYMRVTLQQDILTVENQYYSDSYQRTEDAFGILPDTNQPAMYSSDNSAFPQIEVRGAQEKLNEADTVLITKIADMARRHHYPTRAELVQYLKTNERCGLQEAGGCDVPGGFRHNDEVGKGEVFENLRAHGALSQRSATCAETNHKCTGIRSLF